MISNFFGGNLENLLIFTLVVVLNSAKQPLVRVMAPAELSVFEHFFWAFVLNLVYSAQSDFQLCDHLDRLLYEIQYLQKNFQDFYYIIFLGMNFDQK